MLDIEIDGRQIEVAEGSTVMDAAVKLGIYVPHFCYHKKLSIAASCRMCLVQVEKAPKPLPACATPVTKGMKVWTHSAVATKAQQGVMEFLLVNHPLDCPICDQGGECQLQDLAVGYGSSGARYQEEKRVVVNKNLGALISTDMTRCIHCTRCVRFGQEVAGVMELGVANRGERSEIMAFMGRTVDSELSGNAIDLCPVGALTSKPFRYSARTWELTRRASVSPHCGLGSNLVVQSKGGLVKRVLPAENEAVNECWLSDKDRFSYEGLNAPDRLTRPMIRRDSNWVETDWQTALEFTASKLKQVVQESGPDQLGALASPHATLEELHLTQRLVRGLGSGNVDFRLRQTDFSADGRLAGVPWLGMAIGELGNLDRVLVVGSFLRKDHPLLAHRLRQAAKRGSQISVIHVADDDWLLPVTAKKVVAPSALMTALAEVVVATELDKGRPGSADVAGLLSGEISPEAKAIAQSLASGERVGVLLGNTAQHHPHAVALHALAGKLAQMFGATVGFLGEAANSVGGYVAGAVPFGQLAGRNAAAMFAEPRKAYVLLGVEPEFDCHDPHVAMAAMERADFVVSLSPYRMANAYADVMLPIAPFSETSGTFVNTEGRVQSFSAAVPPKGDVRPGWKVLRVLGSMLGLAGMDVASSEMVRDHVLGGAGREFAGGLDNTPPTVVLGPSARPTGLERIGEVPIHAADPLVRRAPSLQRTADGRAPGARMNERTLQTIGVVDGKRVKVTQSGVTAEFLAQADASVPDFCVRLAAAHPATAVLGPMFGAISVEPV